MEREPNLVAFRSRENEHIFSAEPKERVSDFSSLFSEARADVVRAQRAGIIERIRGTAQGIARAHEFAAQCHEALVTSLPDAKMALAFAAALLTSVARAESGMDTEARNVHNERVRVEMLANFEKEYPYFVQELGERNADALREALKDFSPRKVEDAIAEDYGVSPERLQGVVRSIEVVSDHTIGEIVENEPYSQLPNSIAVTLDDRIRVRASAFKGKDCSFSENALYQTLVHEQFHVHTTIDNPEVGGQTPSWELTGIPRDFGEGVAEVLSQRTAARLGHKAEHHGYHGGDFMSAYLVEQAVGTQALGQEFLSATDEKLRASLDTYFSPGAANDILRVEWASEGDYRTFSARPEGLMRTWRIVDWLERSGKDVGTMLDKARTEGFAEDLSLIREPDGIRGLLFVDDNHPGMDVPLVRGVFELPQQGVRADPPVRVVLTNESGVIPSELMESFAIRERESLLKGYAERLAHWQESGKEFTVDEQQHRLLRMDTGFYAEPFNLTVNAKDSLAPLLDAYRQERTDGQRKAIEDAARGLGLDLARQVMVSLEQ